MNMDGVRPEIWAFGFRNPWQLTFDNQTGTLWMADVGQDLQEEINLVEKEETTVGDGEKGVILLEIFQLISQPLILFGNTIIRLVSQLLVVLLFEEVPFRS